MSPVWPGGARGEGGDRPRHGAVPQARHAHVGVRAAQSEFLNLAQGLGEYVLYDCGEGVPPPHVCCVLFNMN